MIKHYKAATGNKMDKHRGMEGVQIQTHDTLSASNTTKTSCTETVSQRQHATTFCYYLEDMKDVYATNISIKFSRIQ